MKRNNLNELPLGYAYLHSPDANGVSSQKNHSINVEQKMYAETHFKDLDKVLVDKINQADAVVGCVAWLTHEKILNALANREHGVSIIIQKEDFLRPDLSENDSYADKLRMMYNALSPIKNWGEVSYRKKVDYNGFDSTDYWDWYDEAQQWIDLSIRCVGFRKRPNEYAMPRMHHKFLVFCNYREVKSGDFPFSDYYHPYAVWTGSFNMTKNGTYSLENGIYIKDSSISSSYYKEWKNMLMLSEDLDWESEWAAPDVQELDECSIIS